MLAPGSLVCFALIGVASSQSSDCSYVGLLQHLNVSTSNDLLSIMRPVKNWTTSTHVQLNMLLFGILEVDEKCQTVTSHVWIQMTWTNEFLTWNSSEFCGIDVMSLPTSILWVPDISIQEDASDTGSIHRGHLARLSPDGSVLTTSRQRLTSTCELNLRLFPFDKQVCEITFSSSTCDASSITLTGYNDSQTLTQVSEQLMVTHGEWALKHINVAAAVLLKQNRTESRVTYTVTVVRKPMLYVINLILPLFYFLVLDLASFFIHEARGEKLSFKVTILLSISVLLLILQDMLPSTEDQLPMIASYCVAIFTLVGFSVLEAMVVSFLTDLDGRWRKKTRQSGEPENQLEDDVHREPAAAEDPEKPENGHLPLDVSNARDLLEGILQEVKAARQEERNQEKTELGYYRRVAEIIDSVFFVLYVLSVVTFLLFMYTMWIHKYVEHSLE